MSFPTQTPMFASATIIVRPFTSGGRASARPHSRYLGEVASCLA
jgi:hypothetical protein